MISKIFFYVKSYLETIDTYDAYVELFPTFKVISISFRGHSWVSFIDIYEEL